MFPPPLSLQSVSIFFDICLMKTDQGEPWRRFLFPSVFQDFPIMGITWVLKLAFYQRILNSEVHTGPDNFLFQTFPGWHLPGKFQKTLDQQQQHHWELIRNPHCQPGPRPEETAALGGAINQHFNQPTRLSGCRLKSSFHNGPGS